MALQLILEEFANGKAAPPMHMRMIQRASKQGRTYGPAHLEENSLRMYEFILNVSDGAVTH